MKAFLFAAGFAAVASAALAAAAPAPPAELEALRKSLSAAVKAVDRKAIVALSRFPLAFSGYEAPDKITEAQFLNDKNQFGSLFGPGGDAGIVSCLATGKLEYQAEKPDFPGSPWFLDCNGNEYYFGLVGGKWRFTSYMNINE
jgi:hypothetical protein